MFNTAQVYSGSYNFSPSAGEIILNAYGRIQVYPTEILASHIQQATMEMNLLLAKFNNQTPNLWAIDLEPLPLTQGVATYSMPNPTIQILDCFIRENNPGTDTMLYSMSRTEYAAVAQKTTQGPPNQFWFNRQISPEITLYPVPDGNGPYTLYCYIVRNIQDAYTAGGLNVEVPTLWVDALTAGLAHRLARIYKPELEDRRKADADESWNIAATQNVENVNLYIAPSLGGYFTR